MAGLKIILSLLLVSVIFGSKKYSKKETNPNDFVEEENRKEQKKMDKELNELGKQISVFGARVEIARKEEITKIERIPRLKKDEFIERKKNLENLKERIKCIEKEGTVNGKEFNDVEANFNKLKDDFIAKKERLNAYVNGTKNKQTDEFEKDVAAKNKKFEEFEEQITKLEKKLADKELQIIAVNKNLKDAETCKKTLEEDKAKLESDFTQKDKEVNGLNETISGVRKDLETSKAELAKEKTKLQKLQNVPYWKIVKDAFLEFAIYSFVAFLVFVFPFATDAMLPTKKLETIFESAGIFDVVVFTTGTAVVMLPYALLLKPILYKVCSFLCKLCKRNSNNVN